jgi:hypothetical protein
MQMISAAARRTIFCLGPANFISSYFLFWFPSFSFFFLNWFLVISALVEAAAVTRLHQPFNNTGSPPHSIIRLCPLHCHPFGESKGKCPARSPPSLPLRSRSLLPPPRSFGDDAPRGRDRIICQSPPPSPPAVVPAKWEELLLVPCPPPATGEEYILVFCP